MFCFLLQNRRVLCIKEVEILGHMSIDWQYPFEDFVSPPSVHGNLLKISVKVRINELHVQSQEFVVWVETSAFWLSFTVNNTVFEGSWWGWWWWYYYNNMVKYKERCVIITYLCTVFFWQSLIVLSEISILFNERIRTLILPFWQNKALVNRIFFPMSYE